MVIIITRNNIQYYNHIAYATDDNGTDFSLTEFDNAVYMGTYEDKTATESENYADYTWTLINESSDTEETIEETGDETVIALNEAIDYASSVATFEVGDGSGTNLKASTDKLQFGYGTRTNDNEPIINAFTSRIYDYDSIEWFDSMWERDGKYSVQLNGCPTGNIIAKVGDVDVTDKIIEVENAWVRFSENVVETGVFADTLSIRYDTKVIDTYIGSNGIASSEFNVAPKTYFFKQVEFEDTTTHSHINSTGKIMANGNITSGGTITSNDFTITGHSSPIGKIATRSRSSYTTVNITVNTTWKAVLSLGESQGLTKGKWIITALVSSDSTGSSATNIRANMNTTSAYAYVGVSNYSPSGQYNRFRFTQIFDVEEGDTIYLNVYSASSIALGSNTTLRAIRIW